jgi:alkylation response protein AidB-like acyl-CoA dehydrogenase
MANRYQAPLALVRLALNQAAETSGARTLPGYDEALADLAEPILENASRFAGDVLSPLNPVGDQTPSHCESNGVVTPPGFVEAYRRFREDGWVSLAAPEEYGGQGLSTLISAAVTEMWGGANLSFAMCPELTVGALGALKVHGTAQLIDTYASYLASGEWATAMCLTEPQAGSDLSTLRTRAEPDGDSWRLFGRKIYISWGDHDMTDNIVHFVLARTPDAPAGLKGISLFLVPKKVPAAGGVLTKNDIDAVSLEHKMGIRASPTCVMVIGERDGARGWLIGRLHDGLGCMFTMMNHMRLGVGLHSLGLAERSLQLARDHARERLQGRDAAGAQRPIIEHADVRRMLLTMKSLTQAARGLAYTAAATLDVAHSAPVETQRAAAMRRADLLTPIVKAWCSDVAVEVASLGVQIHGGMVFVDDAEISQVYRDARIGPIFEGTNYIQAQDLLGRKVIRDKAAVLGELLVEIEKAAQKLPGAANTDAPNTSTSIAGAAVADTHTQSPATANPLTPLRSALLDSCARLRAATTELIANSAQQPDLIGATAYHFLQWLAVLAGGWQLALAATRAAAESDTGTARATADMAAFYAAHILPRALAHEVTVRNGTAPITTASAADL